MTAGSGEEPTDAPRHLVVMGVSGVGKSTVARLLSSRLGFEMAEGDEFHPKANIDKMTTGTPLDDADRLPWLRRLAAWARERDQSGRSTVMTCSALRRRYRDVLREGAPTYFVHLVGTPEQLLERMRAREHFMPPSLLRSQFEALEDLEPDEAGVTVDVTAAPDEVVKLVVSSLDLG